MANPTLLSMIYDSFFISLVVRRFVEYVYILILHYIYNAPADKYIYCTEFKK